MEVLQYGIPWILITGKLMFVTAISLGVVLLWRAILLARSRGEIKTRAQLGRLTVAMTLVTVGAAALAIRELYQAFLLTVPTGVLWI